MDGREEEDGKEGARRSEREAETEGKEGGSVNLKRDARGVY